MERGAVIITIEIGMRKRKLPESMRAVDNHFDPALPAHLANRFDGKDLSSPVGDMTDVYHSGLRCDVLLDARGKIVEARWRHRERDLLEHDSVASGALFPGSDHA